MDHDDEFGSIGGVPRIEAFLERARVDVVLADWLGHYSNMRLENPWIGATPFVVDKSMSAFLDDLTRPQAMSMIVALTEDLFDAWPEEKRREVAAEHECGGADE